MAINIPPEIDQKLWVVLRSGERGYIRANSHTFPGRFNIRLVDEQDVLIISKGDIAEASECSRCWIEGFLAGNEPSPGDIWGDEATLFAHDGPELQSWRAALRDFHDSGKWKPYMRCLSCGALQLLPDM